MTDAAYIYGHDPTRLPATVAPYIAWTGKPRPTVEDCGQPHCREARERDWARADAAYERENAARRHADDMEWDNAQLRRQIAQLTRAIEGGTA